MRKFIELKINVNVDENEECLILDYSGISVDIDKHMKSRKFFNGTNENISFKNREEMVKFIGDNFLS